MTGTTLSTSSKIPDRYVTKRIGAAGDPCGMPVSAGLASPVLPSSTSFAWRSDMKLPVHLMRSGSISIFAYRSPSAGSALPPGPGRLRKLERYRRAESFGTYDMFYSDTYLT